MRNCIIKEGCEIINCILGINVKVEAGMRLVDCWIGDNTIISLNKARLIEKETLVNMDI